MNNNNEKIFDTINNSDSIVRLDIGCGHKKISVDHIGIDRINRGGVDIVGDYQEALKRIDSSRVDEIYSAHFLEHIDDLEYFVEESLRVLKKGGKAILIAPHFSNPYFYSDPTHVKFFGLYTFCYYAECNFLKRKVPQYEHNIGFKINNVKINFQSTAPFYVRHGFKKTIGMIVNSSNYLKEFWEENLCYALPGYELVYELEKI